PAAARHARLVTMPTAPLCTARSEFSEPHSPTESALPTSVTMTWPGLSWLLKPSAPRPTVSNQMPCALTISSVEPSFHIGLFAGTQRTVQATPQDFIPGASGTVYVWLR